MEEETWHDLSPVAPADRDAVANGERKSPYQITVSYATSKTGPDSQEEAKKFPRRGGRRLKS